MSLRKRKRIEKKGKSQNKGKAQQPTEVADAVTRFLSGDTISEIAAGLYRSSGFVKAIIERTGVPQKEREVRLLAGRVRCRRFC